MSYVNYLQNMLQPLGVYDLTAHSFSGAMLYALGGALDGVDAQLSTALQDALPQTASDEGLAAWEKRFALPALDLQEEDRRSAIAAMMQVRVFTATCQGLETCLAPFGITVADPYDGTQSLAVTLPAAYTQAQQTACKALVESLLPCQVNITYTTA